MARTIARPPTTTDENQATNGLAPLSDDIIARQTDAGSFKPRSRTYFALASGSSTPCAAVICCALAAAAPVAVPTSSRRRWRRRTSRSLGIPSSTSAIARAAAFASTSSRCSSPGSTIRNRLTCGHRLPMLLAGKSREELVALIERCWPRTPISNRSSSCRRRPRSRRTPHRSTRPRSAASLATPFCDRENEEYGGGYGRLRRLRLRLRWLLVRHARVGARRRLRRRVHRGRALAQCDARLGGAGRSSSRRSSTSIRTKRASSPTSSAGPMPISPPASKRKSGCLPTERFTDEERARLIDAILAIWEADLDAWRSGLFRWGAGDDRRPARHRQNRSGCGSACAR